MFLFLFLRYIVCQLAYASVHSVMQMKTSSKSMRLKITQEKLTPSTEDWTIMKPRRLTLPTSLLIRIPKYISCETCDDFIPQHEECKKCSNSKVSYISHRLMRILQGVL